MSWTYPAGTFQVPSQQHTAPHARRVLLGAHPGAGASTWALLLDMVDAEHPPADGQVTIVCRSTIHGITAAKHLIAQITPDHVEAILVVADAAGRIPATVRRELTVLSGPNRVVSVPWIPALRGVPATENHRLTLARPIRRVSHDLTKISRR